MFTRSKCNPCQIRTKTFSSDGSHLWYLNRQKDSLQVHVRKTYISYYNSIMPMFSKKRNVFSKIILANNNALLLNFLMWNDNQKLIFASMISQINMEKYKRKTDATTNGQEIWSMCGFEQFTLYLELTYQSSSITTPPLPPPAPFLFLYP